ncbi:MAG: hypothetical protein SCJ94_12210 [Bacillota bacterium]|nr:hypothetical protein [Bacillota bacterium]
MSEKDKELHILARKLEEEKWDPQRRQRAREIMSRVLPQPRRKPNAHISPSTDPEEVVLDHAIATLWKFREEKAAGINPFAEENQKD